MDLRMLGDSLVERAEKIDAAVGIVFPAVFAVEYDAHQRRPMAGVAARGAADGFQLADKIVGRVLRLVALVMEADLVAHGMIAEDDLQALPFFFHGPGAIEHFWIAQEAVAVSRNPAFRGAGKNLFVRGNPFDAGGGDGGDICWQTEPSEGHMPRGFEPKTFSWKATASLICASASSP